MPQFDHELNTVNFQHRTENKGQSTNLNQQKEKPNNKKTRSFIGNEKKRKEKGPSI
jgi:hypothetical protein